MMPPKHESSVYILQQSDKEVSVLTSETVSEVHDDSSHGHERKYDNLCNFISVGAKNEVD